VIVEEDVLNEDNETDFLDNTDDGYIEILETNTSMQEPQIQMDVSNEPYVNEGESFIKIIHDTYMGTKKTLFLVP